MFPPRCATRRARAPFPARILLPLFVAVPSTVQAQEPSTWNSARALELISRAREARQRTAMDPDLRAYQAKATGHVFFLLDRPGSDQRTLVKADQIALEVYWRTPDDTKQRIVGLRDQKLLPTNIRYHLDHLTVVQDDFADRIRLGNGDEVEAVVHPTAPGAEQVYDFRLGDSLTIAFSGTGDEVRVYEIQVRPKELAEPGFVGSVLIDRVTAAIVRMIFTFTPASYVDPYLDYIRISLENSLWEGRWWLPYRQEVEIRREIPRLDFLAGSVIRGRFEIGGYALNPELPDQLFLGDTVTAAPKLERRRYPFREPLVPEADAAQLAPTPSLQEVRAQALELTAGRYLSGLARLRLHVPSASDMFRWNRAEGSFAGLGLAWRPSSGRDVKVLTGWSFGRSEPALALTVAGGESRPGSGVRLTWNELRDLGLFPGAARTVNTFSGLTAKRDWLDPWFASGVELFHAFAREGVPLSLSLRWERHERGSIVLDPETADDFRPLRAVDEGELRAVGIETSWTAAQGVEMVLTAGLARFDPEGSGPPTVHGSLVGSFAWEREWQGKGLELAAQLDGGTVVSEAPRQALFLLGGRGTLPGHPYRAQVGHRFWLTRIETSRRVFPPWLTVRAFAAAGAATLGRSDDALEIAWDASGDAGVLASAGVGVGLGWDVLHLDLGRGLDGGEWELVVSVDRRFRGWL